MTGKAMIDSFVSLIGNDLYPIGTGSIQSPDRTLIANLITLEAKKIMRQVKLDVPVPSALSCVTGQVRYTLDSLGALSAPLVEVLRVQTPTNSYLQKSEIPTNQGWNQVGNFFDLFADFANGDIYNLYGYQGCAAVADTTAVITDLPEECHVAAIFMAVRNASYGQEDSQNELIRLGNMERQAQKMVQEYIAYARSGGWAF